MFSFLCPTKKGGVSFVDLRYLFCFERVANVFAYWCSFTGLQKNDIFSFSFGKIFLVEYVALLHFVLLSYLMLCPVTLMGACPP